MLDGGLSLVVRLNIIVDVTEVVRCIKLNGMDSMDNPRRHFRSS